METSNTNTFASQLRELALDMADTHAIPPAMRPRPNMNNLPHELVDAILAECLARTKRNNVLQLRLVCRYFNKTFKPIALRTLGLDFSRLSRTAGDAQPDPLALQTIGYHAKNMFIDAMVLRDDSEIDFLKEYFRRTDDMDGFIKDLHDGYCLGGDTFTEEEYLQATQDMLFYCREVSRLRLNLPYQLVGRNCAAATMILANTFKAFANRPEEDSAPLKVLVLENLPDMAVMKLWMNPIDVSNIINVFSELEHVVFSVKRHVIGPRHTGTFGSCLWNMIQYAENLQSLCFVAMENGDSRPPRGLKQVPFFQMNIEEWRDRALPSPQPQLLGCDLKSLELKKVELMPDFLIQMAKKFPQLEELYLNEDFLKVEQSRDSNNADHLKHLWIGIPNTRPPLGAVWVATELRVLLPKLQICRASFLGYDHYLHDTAEERADFDLADPSGLSRSVSQRFVEVVTGIQQPPLPCGQPVEYLPSDAIYDTTLTTTLKQRKKPLSVVEYDINAYQTVGEATPSRWQTQGLDGLFQDCNPGTIEKLHGFAEEAVQGMNRIQGNGTAMDVNYGVNVGEGYWDYNQ